jgi:SagB-type dehydrogenase family enzyme
MSNALDQVLIYHQQTKHYFNAYARSLGYLDWATQPDPFRRYHGARTIELDKIPPGKMPLYESGFVEGGIAPAPLNVHSISQLFFDSLAISAWKSAAGTSWALRVNPSSGNLHPTEGYLICGPVEGLCETPVVCHYAPKEHALEERAELTCETWRKLVADLPQDTVLVGLTSIHWREAWKYGERAFRYCHHDVGHALAAVGIAAAGLGWKTMLLDGLGSEEIARLLGLSDAQGAEAEYPDCVLAIYPQGQSCETLRLPTEVLEGFTALNWHGRPNQLSPDHVDWPIIEAVATATRKPPATDPPINVRREGSPLIFENTGRSLRQIIRQRRSAVAMDGQTSIPRDLFYKILHKTLSGPERFPFNMLPWPPHVHLTLFVHRVQGLVPGLYLLVRAASQQATLRNIMRNDFLWERPEACPESLPLYRLTPGDAQRLSQQLSCHQAIASDGCFSLGMLARFLQPLERYEPWFYPRLFWESGMIGQVLYLEAEAAELRGTGIGCFFDDPVHDTLGLTDMQYQSLYHFTMGGYVEDSRLTTLPAYPQN